MAETIKGLRELYRKLDALGFDAMGALENAVGQTTLVATGDAKAMVPVDTSALKNSIFMNVERFENRVEGTVFTNSPYAVFQELGTYNMAAQPYMLPALEENSTTFVERCENELKKLISRIAGGI